MYKKEHYLVAALSFLFVLVFYFLTMAPTVTFWDAGEFISASYCLGIPHPPGTPLFVLIGRVLSILPVHGDIAARLNLVSVLSGALNGLLICLIAVKILETMVDDPEKPNARLVVSAGAFTCSIIPPFLFTVWSNSTEFEVYSIATTTIFFCAWLMIYMGSLKDPKRIKNILLLVVYIVSLSIANHLIVLLVAPAVIVYTLLHDRRNWKYWCSVLGSFLGLYLMVMKGLDLNSVAERLSIKDLSGTGLFVAGYRVTAALLGIVSSIHQYLASPSGFIFGLLITAGSVYWAYRRKALDFFGAALGLFLLGFSIHLYLLIRSGLNPPVNMGQPETLKAFWAVISREQYGSAYGILPRQVWQMITQKADISSLSDLAANIKVYFQYNLPFYTKYFGWQFGHGFWALIFTALGIYGAVEHARHEKKSFYFWLAVFLMTGLILNTYMNFKLGYSQALDKYPKDTPLHEVRERDYFFIVSFAFFGVWSGLGLAAVLDRLRKAFAVDTDDPKLRKPVFYLLAAAVLLPGLVPLILNFGKVDRSGNYIPPDYARNVMNSLEPGAIIFTNGDNDTYPLWYIREVEGVRTDCRVVNLSLLNTGWYIKQMRDMEPKVPISLSDEAIWKLRPFILQKGHKFQFGEVELIFQDSSVIDIKDMVILDILRTNNWRKPLYFTTTTPTSNRCHLEPYLVQHGVVYKINPRRARSLAAEDSMNLIEIGGNGACFDIRDTRRLFDRVYRFKAFPHDPAELEEEEVQALGPFAYASSVLGQAYSQRGEFADAAEILSTARQLRNDRHQLNMVMANLYTRSSQYEKAYAFLDSLVNVTGDRNPQVFMELAQIALSKGGTGPSLKLMEMCTDFFPDYKDAYANLFMVHEADGDTAAAVAVVGKYLELFPEDNVVAEELKRYRETGEIDLRKAFQIPLP